MVTGVSAQGMRALQPIDRKSDEHDVDHLPWQPRTSGRLKD